MPALAVILAIIA